MTGCDRFKTDNLMTGCDRFKTDTSHYTYQGVSFLSWNSDTVGEKYMCRITESYSILEH